MDHVMITPDTHEVVIDGVVHKTGSRHYLYPPGKLPEADIIATFEENLREIIPTKLRKFMDRQDELLASYRETIKFIEGEANAKRIDSFGEYFLTFQAEIEFMEYAVINRWLKYHLRLAGKVAPERPWIEQGVLLNEDMTQEQIEEAKSFPIEEMYEGKLWVNGQRLVGRCPFHEEKTPSFTIFRNDNGFYCFGCHKHGDAIDYYMLKHKVENWRDAVKALI